MKKLKDFRLPASCFLSKGILMMLIIILVMTTVDLAYAQSDPKYQITKDDYNNQNVEMADGMRANGKIYVVVSVMTIIFAGLAFYMYRTDQKISALEKEIEK